MPTPYPVSVVVPLTESRRWFFERFSLPSIRAAGAGEVIVVPGAGGAPVKRNEGAAKATRPYLLFVDDDTLLGEDFIRRAFEILSKIPRYGFVYSDYAGVPWAAVEGSPAPFVLRSHKFDRRSLRESNYIDTTSMLRRDLFPGFDPALSRFQDWDLWLTLSEKGIKGCHIPEILFVKFMLDAGISGSVPMDPAWSYLKGKHRIE